MTDHILTRLKAYTALLGAVVTALLGIYGPDTVTGHWLTVAAAVLTAVGTYAAPNADTDTEEN